MARITRSKVDHDMKDQLDELKAFGVCNQERHKEQVFPADERDASYEGLFLGSIEAYSSERGLIVQHCA